MTDRELLELAAKAAGIEVMDWYGDRYSCRNRFETDLFGWNPLTDDGDALRLAVKLALHIEHRQINDTDFVIAYDTGNYHGWKSHYDQDPYAATRRAIVRAAAEIGKEM